MYVDQNRYNLSWKKTVLLNILIAGLYVLLGNASFYFSRNISSSPLWAPSGLALGIVMIFGLSQSLTGLFIGMTALALQRWSPSLTTLGFVLSTLLEVIIASVLLSSFGGGKYRFKSPKDIFGFILISAILAPFVSSTLAVGVLYTGNMIPDSGIQTIWVTHFIHDGLGILVVTPLVVSFFSRDMRKANGWEAIILYATLALASDWGFSGPSIRKFLIIPLLTWSALRFGFRGISIGTIIVGFIAVWKSNQLGGVFERRSLDIDFLIIQLMIAGVSIVGFFMATVVEAQETANEKEIELSIKDDALAILDQSLHKSPFGFALIDREMKFIRVNEALSLINGIDANEHLGKTVAEIIPGLSERVIPMIQDVLKTGRSYTNIPFSGYTPYNAQKFVAGILSYYPVRHPTTQEIFAVAFSFQDITELSKIQTLLTENKERMRFAQEAGRIGAFEWNVETNRILWNQELENIYELCPGDFGGLYENWLLWIHPSDLAEFNLEINQVLLEEKELNYEFRIITKSDITRWILARGRVITENDGTKKLIGINIDITDQKETEEKLRLTEANLLHALSVRDEFMAIASHELKTPLTSLKLANQFFQRGLTRDDGHNCKILTFIERNCVQIDRLTRLVDDMLDISRIRTGKLSLKKESCELSQMLNDIINRCKDQFETSGSGFPIIENMETAKGEWDPLRIDQVLTNIITNAIRYGQGKPIRISLKNHQESVRVIVKDQGLGIPKSDQDKIFKRYERGLLAREVSGLGLGLFISKQIIDAHGGSIWVESEVNQGATFIVDLPRTCVPIILKPEINDIIEAES